MQISLLAVHLMLWRLELKRIESGESTYWGVGWGKAPTQFLPKYQFVTTENVTRTANE